MLWVRLFRFHLGLFEGTAVTPSPGYKSAVQGHNTSRKGERQAGGGGEKYLLLPWFPTRDGSGFRTRIGERRHRPPELLCPLPEETDLLLREGNEMSFPPPARVQLPPSRSQLYLGIPLPSRDAFSRGTPRVTAHDSPGAHMIRVSYSPS